MCLNFNKKELLYTYTFIVEINNTFLSYIYNPFKTYKKFYKGKHSTAEFPFFTNLKTHIWSTLFSFTHEEMGFLYSSQSKFSLVFFLHTLQTFPQARKIEKTVINQFNLTIESTNVTSYTSRQKAGTAFK